MNDYATIIADIERTIRRIVREEALGSLFADNFGAHLRINIEIRRTHFFPRWKK